MVTAAPELVRYARLRPLVVSAYSSQLDCPTPICFPDYYKVLLSICGPFKGGVLKGKLRVSPRPPIAELCTPVDDC
jgi:hypothetical protein